MFVLPTVSWRRLANWHNMETEIFDWGPIIMFTSRVQLGAVCLMYWLVLKHLTFWYCKQTALYEQKSPAATYRCRFKLPRWYEFRNSRYWLSFAFPSTIRLSCASVLCCSFIKGRFWQHNRNHPSSRFTPTTLISSIQSNAITPQATNVF